MNTDTLTQRRESLAQSAQAMRVEELEARVAKADAFFDALDDCQIDFWNDEDAEKYNAAVAAYRGKKKTNRDQILDAARQAVTTDRAATHGDLEDNFGSIAAIWSTRLGQTVTPEQVAIMMIDLKTVRAWGNSKHEDNWIDMAGYAACGGELA